MTKRTTFPYVEGARHSERTYDQSAEAVVLAPGDRLLIVCEGGPFRAGSRSIRRGPRDRRARRGYTCSSTTAHTRAMALPLRAAHVLSHRRLG